MVVLADNAAKACKSCQFLLQIFDFVNAVNVWVRIAFGNCVLTMKMVSVSEEDVQ